LDLVQAGGTVGDKNFLGLMSHFIGIPWLALLLAGQRGKMPYIAPLATAVAVVSTVSRAALGLTAVGMGLMFFVSAARKWTARKITILTIAVFALLLLVPVAISSLETRFAHESTEFGYDERAAFEHAAMMAWSDHPMGVGANNYVVAANVQGYNEK